MHISDKIRSGVRAAPKSAVFLISIFFGVLLTWVAVLIYFGQTIYRVPVCFTYRVTGIYCLTCGATRATGELAHLRLVKSFMLNPIPLLVSIFLLTLFVHYVVGFIREEDRPYRFYYVWIYTILTAAIVFCVLRNVGILPILLTNQ